MTPEPVTLVSGAGPEWKQVVDGGAAGMVTAAAPVRMTSAPPRVAPPVAVPEGVNGEAPPDAETGTHLVVVVEPVDSGAVCVRW